MGHSVQVPVRPTRGENAYSMMTCCRCLPAAAPPAFTPNAHLRTTHHLPPPVRLYRAVDDRECWCPHDARLTLLVVTSLTGEYALPTTHTMRFIPYRDDDCALPTPTFCIRLL